VGAVRRPRNHEPFAGIAVRDARAQRRPRIRELLAGAARCDVQALEPPRGTAWRGAKALELSPKTVWRDANVLKFKPCPQAQAKAREQAPRRQRFVVCGSRAVRWSN
ncbi:MAG: hypothetical protein KDG44_00185, partial [Burkholderiaceae bacterium]|nr:hypothetical protein [Burkholderiaceae bacterium]